MGLKHFNSKHIKLDEVGSTNTYLQALNKEVKQNCGTIISAINQTDGKGQKGNVWEVIPGDNLTFSLVVYPDIKPKYAFYLNIIVSLAVQKTLTDLKIDSKIKWPNDILVGKNKICGILVENQMNGSSISQSIIGVGLNVNQLTFDQSMKATSIKKEGGTADKEEVLIQLYAYLDFYYNLLLESNFDLLLKHYYSNLFWFEKEGLFEDESNQFKARLNGITDVGLLSLTLIDNTNKTYDLKEIKFIY